MTTLKKKHYTAIANLLRTALADEVWNEHNKPNPTKYKHGQEVVSQLIDDFIIYLERDNPKSRYGGFDRKKFLKSCGVEE